LSSARRIYSSTRPTCQAVKRGSRYNRECKFINFS